MKFQTTAAVLICFLALASASALSALGQNTGAEVFPDGTKSDGCTLIPDGHIRDCCLRHDQEYFVGGTRKERRESDKQLYHCVRKKKGFGHKLVAPFIWLGVRIGGVPFLSTPFRWGFGKFRKRKQVEGPPEAKPTPQFNCRP